MRRISWRSPVVLILGFELIIALWVVVRVATVYLDLHSAQTSAMTIESALRDQHAESIGDQVSHLQKRAHAAASGSSGPTWKLFEHVPFIGDDARTIADLSVVVNDLAQNVVPPAVEAGRMVQAHGILDQQGALNLPVIERVTPDLRRARAGVDLARTDLAGIDTSGNIAKLATSYQKLSTTIRKMAGLLDSGDRALAVLPSMAGKDGPRHYLLVLQNNAEIRSSGGLPGVIVELTVDHGHIARGKPISTSSTFAPLTNPILPLSPAESALYGPWLGEHVTESNLTPDFPRTASLIAARWRHQIGTPVDGVLMMDTVSLGYLLNATGPITVDGIRLTADNAVQELLADTYVRLAHQYTRQDAFFQAVAEGVFTRITSGQANTAELARAVARAAVEGRLRVRSFNADEEKQIGDTAVGGSVAGDPRTPETGVYVNDVTSSKMSIFLDYAVNVTANQCVAGRQHLSADMTLASSAPRNMSGYDHYVTGIGTNAPIGSEALAIALYAPRGGSIVRVMRDGHPVNAITRTIGTRRVTVVRVMIGPSSISHLTWSVNTGRGQRGNVMVDVTPSAVPGNKSSLVAGSC